MTAATSPQAPANGTQVAKPDERATEFVPFQSKESIRLNVSIVKNLLCVKTKSGKVCDDAQAIKFIMLCKARLLNPFEGDAFLIGYDAKDGPKFNLITAHQAFLKRAEVHPEYDGMESGVIVAMRDGSLLDREGDFVCDGDQLVGGWAVVFFKNRSHPMKKRLKLSTYNKGFGRWNEDQAGMIVKCAEADALRSSFPSTLGGLYLDEELPPPEVRVKGGAGQAASGQGSRTDLLLTKLGHKEAEGAPEPTQPIIDRLGELVGQLDLSQKEVATLLQRYGVASLEQLSDEQASELETSLAAQAEDARRQADSDSE